MRWTPARPHERKLGVSGARLDFSFDARVATQYDALRGHPSHVSGEIGRAIAAVVGPGARVLELGVGTGRIALPLAGAGCRVVGIDLSAQMLAALSRQCSADPTLQIELVRGSIAALPFQPASFDAALAVHVLHLVADWQQTLDRMLNVVRAGGCIVLGRDWVDPTSMAGQIRMAFRHGVMDLGYNTAAPAAGRALDEALRARGVEPLHAGAHELIASEWHAELSPADVLEGIRSREDAESWVLPDEILEPVCRTLENFSAHQWPARDARQTVLRRFVMAVYRT